MKVWTLKIAYEIKAKTFEMMKEIMAKTLEMKKKRRLKVMDTTGSINTIRITIITMAKRMAMAMVMATAEMMAAMTAATAVTAMMAMTITTARTFEPIYFTLANRNQAGVESGVLYGLSCRINGSSVINPYTIEKSPIHEATHVNTSRSTLNR